MSSEDYYMNCYYSSMHNCSVDSLYCNDNKTRNKDQASR